MSTPLTKAKALSLVKRWECLGYPYPRTTEGVQALTEEFSRITGSEEAAQTLSDKVLQGCSRCPTPIELRRIFDKLIGKSGDGKRIHEVDLADIMDGQKQNRD